VRFSTYSGLGDQAAVTALVREYKKKYPDERIEPLGDTQKALLKGNPHLDGSRSNGITFVLNPMSNETLGNIPLSFAKQVGITMEDTTPEIFLTPEERDAACARFDGFPLAGRIVAIDSWANWNSRRWPHENFVKLTELLKADGWLVVELGKTASADVTPKPPPTHAPRLRWSPLPASVSFVDKLSIRETAAVLAVCDLYIGNDSGVFHLAAGVGTPQFVFFSVKRWYSRAYWNTVPIHAMRNCDTGCFYDCVAKKPCLEEVEPEYVVRKIAASPLFRRYRA